VTGGAGLLGRDLLRPPEFGARTGAVALEALQKASRSRS